MQGDYTSNKIVDHAGDGDWSSAMPKTPTRTNPCLATASTALYAQQTIRRHMKGSTAHGRDRVAISKTKTTRKAADGKSSVSRSVSKSSTSLRTPRVRTARTNSQSAGRTYDRRTSRASRATPALSSRARARVTETRDSWISSGRALEVVALLFFAAVLWVLNPDLAVGAIAGYIARMVRHG